MQFTSQGDWWCINDDSYAPQWTKLYVKVSFRLTIKPIKQRHEELYEAFQITACIFLPRMIQSSFTEIFNYINFIVIGIKELFVFKGFFLGYCLKYVLMTHLGYQYLGSISGIGVEQGFLDRLEMCWIEC